MRSVLEVCVDSTASALAAKRGGADRLELCADLIVGGTTPSLTLVQQVKAETGLPVRALLRPRFGDFCYDSYELAQMEQLAAELVEAGADGIVTGVLTPEGALMRSHAAHLCGGRARQQRRRAVRWRVPCTAPLTSVRTPLLRWKQPGRWAFVPSSPADRRPARRRALHCCGS